MSFQTSLGIDIGHNALSVGYLKTSLKGARLAAHAIYPLDSEQTKEMRAGLIGDLVSDFLKKNRISPTTIFLGIPRDAVILRYAEFPLAVRENLRDTLRYEMEKYVPFPVDETCFDYQIIAEDKETGKLTLLFIVVKKESLNPYLVLGERFGTRISGIEISSTAMANCFSSRAGKDEGEACAIIYLRNGHLELDLLLEGRLRYSRSLKRTEWQDKLPGLVLQELQKLKRGLGENHGPLDTVFCGSETDVDLIDPLKGEKDLDFHLVDLSRTGIPSFGMIPAYGLALKGIQKVPMEIDLLPLELRKKPNKIAYYTMFVLAGFALLSALVWGGGYILRQKLTLDHLNAEIKRLGSEIKKIDQVRAKGKGIENRIEYLNSLRQGGAPVMDILKEFSETIPEDAWVSRFKYSEKGIQIEGQASAASELIPLLETSPLFRNVAFLSTITTGRDGKERFRIGLKLN